uniref:Uncharacterized protein n=1 Tax=Chromera velia CCMP2878 TaxID=1169474 RepID=A0A0G4I9E1_9ALVE|eukprot:Cvel_12107.t1-p1 / transcript=Cvel_12107.t1 / gene=Cvel_12107 / organism=Chromera_velia_CCMP2878 / gene_product=hypothetical protein / transcript_product=hypothetical protein / location=Cvel_scaffold780:9447-11538(+) / protein_length=437 / sequence_SO=supercontig / SO=protein_coding / is_pseudo=false
MGAGSSSSSPAAVDSAEQEQQKQKQKAICCCQGSPPSRPLFEIIRNSVSTKDLRALQKYIDDGGLGDDPSSDHFIRRTKSIAFVINMGENLYSLEQNFFIQSEEYNDFSGGYKRTYRKITDDTIQGPLLMTIKQFIDYYNLPQKSVVLAQIQSSIVEAGQFDPRRGSITGQGIHTDGANRAMLVCIRRTNCEGASNQFHHTVDGCNPASDSTVLHDGDACMFKDDSIFHYVSQAAPAVVGERMERSMLILHWPADHYLTGVSNAQNRRISAESPKGVQLRLMEEARAAAAREEEREEAETDPEAKRRLSVDQKSHTQLDIDQEGKRRLSVDQKSHTHLTPRFQQEQDPTGKRRLSVEQKSHTQLHAGLSASSYTNHLGNSLSPLTGAGGPGLHRTASRLEPPPSSRPLLRSRTKEVERVFGQPLRQNTVSALAAGHS